ncbi:subtilisin-like serine protease, partial [Actinomortierella wolfii]
MKILSLLVVACLVASTAVDGAGVLVRNPQRKGVSGKYIVMLKRDAVSASAASGMIKHISAQGRRRKTPKVVNRLDGLHGFTIEDAEHDVQELLRMNEVDYIEEDAEFRINVPVPPPAYNSTAAEDSLLGDEEEQEFGAFLTQNKPPTWALPRITQREKLPTQKPPFTPFKYPLTAGRGITAYVIDTGVDVKHIEFQERARMGANFIRGSRNTDENGHGTHVAGTINAITFGVAKKTEVVGVKVLGRDGGGTTSGIVAGMDFVLRDARGKRAIVNMSLGGGVSRAINAAVGRLVAANIPVFVAAGNDAGIDACNQSPAGARNAFTVGATDVNDRIARFSSPGRCVDILAPGVDIISSFPGGRKNDAFRTLSGTSMASPHVA